MDDHSLPNDVTECHQLLLAAFRQSVQFEQQAADAKRQAERQVAELNRVLDETAVSYESLQQEHAATLDELAWYKRWAFGRRRERFHEDEGQGHLFDLDSDSLANADLPKPASSDNQGIDVQSHRRGPHTGTGV